MKEGNLKRHLDGGKDSLIPRPFVGETNSLSTRQGKRVRKIGQGEASKKKMENYITHLDMEKREAGGSYGWV